LSGHLAWDMRVVGSNYSRNLQAIFDPGLPQKNSAKFPGQIRMCLLMINFAKRTLKTKKK